MLGFNPKQTILFGPLGNHGGRNQDVAVFEDFCALL